MTITYQDWRKREQTLPLAQFVEYQLTADPDTAMRDTVRAFGRLLDALAANGHLTTEQVGHIVDLSPPFTIRP